LAVLAACGLLEPESEPIHFDDYQVQRYAAPPIYAVWWAEAKECAGRHDADLDRVRFFRVSEPGRPDLTQFTCLGDGTECPGFWQRPHDIYLADGVTESRWVVEHEMLHDIYQSSSEALVARCQTTRLPFARR
jgi:hypothetical protein